jgi:hypothetical protein
LPLRAHRRASSVERGEARAAPFPLSLDAIERRLASCNRREARLRYLRSGFARQLLRSKAWTRLGFVRLGDYARERLGIAGRTLEEDARVHEALDRLPRTLAAFLEAELSWTAARLIASIAGFADEAEWIDRAKRSTVRELEAAIRHRAGPVPASQEAEESIHFSVRVSRVGRRWWRVAHELAERTNGSTLTPSQVLELIVAEASSVAPVVARTVPVKPAASACEHTYGDSTERPQSPGPSSRFLTRSGDLALSERDPELAAFLRSEGLYDEPVSEREAGWRPHGVDAAPDPRLSHHLDAIVDEEDLRGVLPPRRDKTVAGRLDALFDSFEANDSFVIDARLREVERALQRIGPELGALLRLALDRSLHRQRGFRRFSDFVEERLDLGRRKAWSLIAIDRAAAAVPLFGDAYRRGRISHLAAAVLQPVLRSSYAGLWIERAEAVTLRRLEDEVAWALDRADADAAFSDLAPPAVDAILTSPPLAPPAADANLTSPPLAPLAADARVQMRAEEGRASSTRHGVILRFRLPADVAILAEHILTSLRRPHESRGETFERVLLGVLQEWMSAPRHRDPVFERDGWRCAVPACRSRRNLHDHHVVFRSHGGANDRDNRITICAAHHLHGLHAGRIRARGEAPHGIVWELGYRQTDGRSLARLRGDRYLRENRTV